MKREPTSTVGGNVNQCCRCAEQNGCSSETKDRVTVWPSIPPPGHISRSISNVKRYTHPNIHCKTTFKAKARDSLSVHQKLNGEEDAIPWTISQNEWVRLFAATGTGLEIITLSAVRQTNTIWHQSRESIKWYKGAYVQNRKRLTDIENKLTVTKEEMGGRGGEG